MAASRKFEPTGHPEDLREVLAVARTVLTQEADVTERLENKARQQVVLAAQWFAVAQAVLAVALNHDGNMALRWVAAALALVGAAALCATVAQSYRVWRIAPINDVTPGGLIQLQRYAHDPDDSVLDELVVYQANILKQRRESNKERADLAKRSEKLWFIAMFLPLIELVFALLAILVK